MPTSFTPFSALAGGALIGTAALLLFLTLGRIAGISGLISGILARGTRTADRAWRSAFILGLIAGPLIAAMLLGKPLVKSSPLNGPLLILAGLAVGLGTGLANGCTSGHGVCGLSRLSRRSIAATGLFMGFGFLTASLLRHLLHA
jgi:uncharacterized membrane protein YedE/YeeE